VTKLQRILTVLLLRIRAVGLGNLLYRGIILGTKRELLMDMQHLEMKYCERCGTLGLRREGSGRIYCAACAHQMAQVFLAPSELRPEAKKPCGSVVGGGAR